MVCAQLDAAFDAQVSNTVNGKRAAPLSSKQRMEHRTRRSQVPAGPWCPMYVTTYAASWTLPNASNRSERQRRTTLQGSSDRAVPPWVWGVYSATALHAPVLQVLVFLSLSPLGKGHVSYCRITLPTRSKSFLILLVTYPQHELKPLLPMFNKDVDTCISLVYLSQILSLMYSVFRPHPITHTINPTRSATTSNK